MVVLCTTILGGKMNIEELNFELECLAEEERQAMLEIEYEAFLEQMYYELECSQWERDMELYENE